MEWVRLFGTTGGLENAGKVADEFGLKVAHGAWLSSDLAANKLEIGSTTLLRGRVAHVNPAQHKIGTYIKVGGSWWTKPTFVQPDVLIGSDGTWNANVTTGGNDTQASHIAVFLVPLSYTLPFAAGQADLPATPHFATTKWSRPGSNWQPLPCKGSALPIELRPRY